MTSIDSLNAPPLRLRTPEDVLAHIPFLVGFHPTESLVGIAIDATKQLKFSGRLDLPPPDSPSVVSRRYAKGVAALFDGQEVSSVLLVVYSSRPKSARTVLRQVRRACLRAGLHVIELIRADGRRYWTETCRDPSCCPLEGTPYDLAVNPTTTAAIVRGEAAFASRDALRDTFAPITGVDAMLMSQATQAFLDELESWPDAEFVDCGVAYAVPLLLGWLDHPRRLSDAEVARMSVYCSHVLVRDAVWLLQRQETAREHAEFWRDLARRAQPPYDVAPLALFAFAAWLRGSGTLARLAVERALEAEPDYGLATLLTEALDHPLSPSTWDPDVIAGKTLDSWQGKMES